MTTQLPLVIVGGGAAGLAAALAAAPMPVLLLSRSEGGNGTASALAQGGIAAALDKSDSAAGHIEDTLVAGARHNNAGIVRWLCAQAPTAIDWLAEMGALFDQDESGHLQLGREGGHRAARIVHAGGDATGAEIIRAMRKRVLDDTRIERREGLVVDALLLRGGRVCGVRTRDTVGNVELIEASFVVLATGGIGAAFARTSNPPTADGSGLALGMCAGAAVRDLEFVQFHPTALDVPGGHCLPLITEALRGAGARLIDASGAPLMQGVHVLGDLAPRDVVARRVWQSQQEGGGVLLDTSAVTGDWEQRFPTVLAACLGQGIDPRCDPIPVTPAAHFHMGGLCTDLDGSTTIPGLYAVGEVACNGAHGANRLASNSLLEAVLCGQRLGRRLVRLPQAQPRGAFVWRKPGRSLAEAARRELRDLLWEAAGPVRDEATLCTALRRCIELAESGWQARLAQALLRAARGRRESLGAHYRSDEANARAQEVAGAQSG
ncbi:L-aspartate oxidase [Dyella amyloliquefaciens]|uniref:L-aspartate oxidase n=1 Tax=Dyella amyloliquefaciens TaxID=1770545 RepID=UPI00102E8FC3|nr:L-aspartate oxidase [Dyella amyloliquefaciens]